MPEYRCALNVYDDALPGAFGYDREIVFPFVPYPELHFSIVEDGLEYVIKRVLWLHSESQFWVLCDLSDAVARDHVTYEQIIKEGWVGSE